MLKGLRLNGIYEVIVANRPPASGRMIWGDQLE
jgi:hypothetical protein